MKIVPLKLQELFLINEIIVQAKSIWNYDEDYLKAAIPLIKITEEWLNQYEGYSIFQDELVGFMGLEISGSDLKLEHLWIHPTKIKQGLGKAAISFLLELAKARGFKILFYTQILLRKNSI